MILNAKEKKALNKYFRDFVLAHKDCLYQEDYEKKTLIKIQKREYIPFDKSWEYLMVVVQMIENKWNLEKIETNRNWVCFTIDNYDGFGDKGMNKLEAFYLCCFKTLENLWKGQKPPFNYENHEPFDEFDLK